MSEQDPAATPTPSPSVSRDRSRVRAAAVLLALVLAVTTLLGVTGDQEPVDRGGQAAASVGCDPVLSSPTSLNRNHVLLPSELDYSGGPPSFGPHLTGTAGFDRAFYTAQDRPEVGRLVHSLEHGFTVLWYDDTAAGDDAAMKALRELAERYQLAGVRLIAAPWRPSDGAAMPAGRHYAATRWSAAADDPSDQFRQRGNWLYCGTLEPADVEAFLERFPNEQSPEPGVGLPEQSAV